MTSGIIQNRRSTVPAAIEAHQGMAVETWIKSKKCCISPEGDQPPKPTLLNVGSPNLLRVCSNKSGSSVTPPNSGSVGAGGM